MKQAPAITSPPIPPKPALVAGLLMIFLLMGLPLALNLKHINNVIFNLGIVVYTICGIYFFYQLFHAAQKYFQFQPTHGLVKFFTEYIKTFTAIAIIELIQIYFIAPVINSHFRPQLKFLVLSFTLPALGVALLIFAMQEVRTKPSSHRLLLLILSGLGSILTIGVVHLIHAQASPNAINLLTVTYSVISIYFFYHILDYLEVAVEHIVSQIWGFKSKNRTLRFFFEFLKLFFAIFIANLLQFYLVTRPILNQTYDPNFLFFALAFSIPSAAIARIIFELRQAQEIALQSRLAQAEAQYNLLEAQMQPHFLFNSLNVLSELIYVDPDMACSVTQQLADLYREILTNSKRNFSNLGSEISILKKYVQIQKIRFGERIRFKCDVDPSLENLSVPSLILQTLVENAIKHGISPRQQGGDIELTVTPVDSPKGSPTSYEITVSNTGELYKGPKTKELGTGLQNTKNRLELFYGRSHGFNIYSDANKTYVKFRVPHKRELQETTL